MVRFDTQRIKQIDLINFCEQNSFHGYKRCGNGASFFSPFRDEKEPSFQVNYYKNIWTWKDWGSGESGDIISLVQALDNCSFAEACQKLSEKNYECSTKALPSRTQQEDDEKTEWVRKTYLNLLKRPSLTKVQKYFESKGVHYHKAMGAVIYRDPEGCDYVGIPLPDPFNMVGLECRGYSEKKRKTIGNKALWVLRRDTKKVLVAESILDALAGEIVLNMKNVSLVSINGVGNAGKFKKLYTEMHPKEVYLALDNDEPGKKAKKEIEDSLRWKWCSVKTIRDHERAGVKDLYRLLANQ